MPGYEAPVYVAWSRRNRSALIRVPLYHPGKEKATRAEIRCPDPSCNPYLAFAGAAARRPRGHRAGYELPDPMETNLYELTTPERRSLGIESLPESLGEAIARGRGVGAGREGARPRAARPAGRRSSAREWDEYRVQVTQWELDRYLRML